MTKRVYLTLADQVYDTLERWANDQGRPVANLAAYLVERAIEDAQKEVKIPDIPINKQIWGKNVFYRLITDLMDTEEENKIIDVKNVVVNL